MAWSLNKKRFVNKTKLLIDGLSHLIYPAVCLICNDELASSENHLCSICHNDLPRTYFERYQEPSPMDKLFWGRVNIESTYSFLQYKGLGASKNLLSAIKYKNNPELANYFGVMIGRQIQFLDKPDVIIPVPLHSKKEFIRGYNQSHEIAKGLSEALHLPVKTSLIIRNEFTETQTKKGRYKRWHNVSGKFLVHPKINASKHILIVDDVVTTGATIESIVREIHKYDSKIKVSVVTLAIAL